MFNPKICCRSKETLFKHQQIIVIVWSRNGANKTKAFVKGQSLHQNDDYVGELLVDPSIADNK